MKKWNTTAALLLAACLTGPAGAVAQDAEAFDATVQPFLATHCLGCHNSNLATANLDLAASSRVSPRRSRTTSSKRC